MPVHAKSGRELRLLTRAEPFCTWFKRYNTLRDNLAQARERIDDLGIDAHTLTLQVELKQRRGDERLWDAGEHDAASEAAEAEYARVENSSFEMLSRFELARGRATASWQDADRLDKGLEDQRQRVSDLRERIDAARRAGTPEGKGEAERLEGRLREQQAELVRLDGELAEARQREDQKYGQRSELWKKVEDAWSRSFGASMARSEYAFRARRAQSDAEAVFAEAGALRRRLDTLHSDREQAVQKKVALQAEFEAHLRAASAAFDCAVVGEFLYWPQPDNVDRAWVLPLIDDGRHLNIQVRALHLYEVARSGGLDRVEPVPEAPEEQDDVRLDAFFEKARA
jgi:chromosome segregation ATPase